MCIHRLQAKNFKDQAAMSISQDSMLPYPYTGISFRYICNVHLDVIHEYVYNQLSFLAKRVYSLKNKNCSQNKLTACKKEKRTLHIILSHVDFQIHFRGLDNEVCKLSCNQGSMSCTFQAIHGMQWDK